MGKKPTQTQINQFQDFTGCKDIRTAKEILEKFNSDVSAASNYYFDKGYGKNNMSSSNLFEKYKDPSNPDMMTQKGIMDFYVEWGVALDSPLCVVFSFLANAKVIRITRLEKCGNNIDILIAI